MTAAGGAMLASLGGLALMAALPVAFFRRGRLTPGWWLTASPFLLAAATLAGGLAGTLEPAVRYSGGWGAVTAGAGVVLALAAIAAMGWAAASHRHPVSLWHQEEDTPEALTTSGAYRWIRHPFYTAFLLLLSACVLAFPHVLTLLSWAVGAVQLVRTARREERRILGSRHRDGYETYRRETGRFVPRTRRRRVSPPTRPRTPGWS